MPLLTRRVLQHIGGYPDGNGQQELGMFHTHVGDTCLMPFHQYEGQGGRLIATALHPGKTPAAKARSARLVGAA